MAAFEYVAVTESGKQKKGVIEADSPRQVRQQLRDQALMPLEVKETRGGQKEKTAPSGRRFSLVGRANMGPGDLALFTRQLGTMLQSGMPVESALSAIAKQTQKPKVNRVVLGLRSGVKEGLSLEQSMKNFPQAFPDLYRATVSAGEHSGHLHLVLDELADYAEQRHETQKQIQGAMIYPALLTLAAMGIVAFLLTVVVPKVVNVFARGGEELPTATRVLIGISDFMGSYWWAVLIVLVGGSVAFSKWLQRPNVLPKWHRLQLRLPVFGRLVLGINTSRVVSTLSILTRSGVQLVKALDIGAQVSSNLAIRRAVEQAAIKVREGQALHRALEKEDVFPPLIVQMIASGEASGELDSMLERASKYQQREWQSLLRALVALFEPVMLLTMGGVVLFIVMAIMTPIFNMNSFLG